MSEIAVRELPLFNEPGTVAVVDAADYERCSRYVWSLTGSHVVSFCTRTGERCYVALARLILREYRWNTVVDHANGNPLDNRRSNLRRATATENARNRRKSRPARGRVAASKYKGVHPSRDRRYYEATITLDGRNKRLGKFVHEEDAARAYDAAARVHFGAFARLNFPQGKAGK